MKTQHCCFSFLRALQSINIREENEKLNIWVAYFNLENEYGNPPEVITKLSSLFLFPTFTIFLMSILSSIALLSSGGCNESISKSIAV